MDEKIYNPSKGSLSNTYSVISNETSKGNISFNWFDEFVPDEDHKNNNSILIDVFNDFSPNLSASYTFSKTEENKLLVDKVHSWLLEMFGEVPLFEDDPKLIEQLINVYKHYTWVFETHESIEYCLKAQASEYEIEGARYKKELEATGVHLEMLSNEATESLEELASFALFLGARDSQKSSLQIAFVEHQDEIFRLKEQISKFLRGKARLEKQIFQIYEDIDVLKRNLQNHDEQKDNIIQKTIQRKKELTILTAKAEEYRERILSLEKNWTNGSVEKGHLRFDDLLKLKREIEENRRISNSIELELKSYNKLPFDITLAKLKYFESNVEKERLQKIKDDLILDIIPKTG